MRVGKYLWNAIYLTKNGQVMAESIAVHLGL